VSRLSDRSEVAWDATLGVMSGGSLRVAERGSRFLAEHRLASFLITAIGAVMLADSVRRDLSEESQINLITWVALALMAYAVIPIWVVLRRVPANVRLFAAWGLALQPVVFGMAAALSGSPVFTMWLGVLLTVGFVAWVLAEPRTRGQPTTDSG
jgi:hypothetical protein